MSTSSAEFGEGYRRAVDVLGAAVVSEGILASTTERANYRRIWARDSVICGLAGLLDGDGRLIDGLASTLSTLRRYQGRHGEIPSNVSSGGVSYGGLAGRSDAAIWYLVGCACLGRLDPTTIEEHRTAIRKALWLLGAWEMNLRGLVYTPLGGTWADEYPLHGYILNVQLLRLWALRGLELVMGDEAVVREADRVETAIRTNYWLDQPGGGAYHPTGYDAALVRSGPSEHWVASFHPGGYSTIFDGLANALALMLDLGHGLEVAKALERVESETGSALTPAYWPPIAPGDSGWDEVATYHAFGLRNEPYEFHNGGLWPMVTGWTAAGLARQGDVAGAARLASAIDDANGRQGWGFYEYTSARTLEACGVAHTTWSAAAAVIAHRFAADPEHAKKVLALEGS